MKEKIEELNNEKSELNKNYSNLEKKLEQEPKHLKENGYVICFSGDLCAKDNDHTMKI
jgi:hypothetical protein